ncbi:MAG: hypothetical protein V1694_04295 [Candidatus Eisenbacteria bacterium]
MRWVNMSLCGLMILMVLAVPVQSAERDKASFPPPMGERVRVDARAPVLVQHTAIVRAVSSDTLWLAQADKPPRAVPVVSITHLEVWRPSGSRSRHAAIGAGAGVVIGVVAFTVLGAVSGDIGALSPAAAGMITGIPTGLLIGTTVGLVLPTGKWEDVTLPGKVSIRSIGNGRPGLTLTVAFL